MPCSVLLVTGPPYNQRMKQVLDFLPAVAFLAAYVLGDIYQATIALIASLALVVIAYGILERRLHKTHFITLLVAAALGGLTLYVHDPRFIKFKPTAVYALFALALLGSQIFGQKVLMQRFGSKMVDLPEALWRKINLAWAVFFVGLAALNLFVAQEFSEATWVKFKVFGFTALTFAFLIAHAPFVARYLPKEE